MRLFVSTGDFSHWHSRGFHYLLGELTKITELSVSFNSGKIQDILASEPVQPDFVLINEYGETNSPRLSGLDSLDIPWAPYLYDLHHKIDERKAALERDNVQHVFSHYRDKFYEWYPDFWDKMLWLPLHACTDVFKDYKLEKSIDYLLMGAVHERIYPLRWEMARIMKGEPGFVHHPHAGYRNFAEDEDALVGEKYAREINRARIFFTCDSIYQYPVAKYFEVLACNTLLLASSSRELRDLGFIPGVHYVAVNQSNFKEKARYYRDHELERKAIAQRGHEMVMAQHSTTCRARQLVSMIAAILDS